MIPSYRLVIVTEALSLCTSHMLSNCDTLSLTLTNLNTHNYLAFSAITLFSWTGNHMKLTRVITAWHVKFYFGLRVRQFFASGFYTLTISKCKPPTISLFSLLGKPISRCCVEDNLSGGKKVSALPTFPTSVLDNVWCSLMGFDCTL